MTDKVQEIMALVDDYADAWHASHVGELSQAAVSRSRAAIESRLREVVAPPVPTKINIPPPQCEPSDVIYAEGWNACCDAYFGGLPPPEPLVVTITTEATPTQPRPQPLTEREKHDWWARDNGMEDLDLAKRDDFFEMLRLVEYKYGITAQEPTE
jgi:hypothetical protein